MPILVRGNFHILQVIAHQILQGLAGVQVGGGGIADTQSIAHIAVDHQVGTLVPRLELQLKRAVGGLVLHCNLALKRLIDLALEGFGVFGGQLILGYLFAVDIIDFLGGLGAVLGLDLFLLISNSGHGDLLG